MTDRERLLRDWLKSLTVHEEQCTDPAGDADIDDCETCNGTGSIK